MLFLLYLNNSVNKGIKFTYYYTFINNSNYFII